MEGIPVQVKEDQLKEEEQRVSELQEHLRTYEQQLAVTREKLTKFLGQELL